MKLLIIFPLVFVMFLGACSFNNNSNKEYQEQAKVVVETTNLKKIQTNSLTYKKFIADGSIKPVFIDNYTYDNNMICYEKRLDAIKVYGLMDLEFNLICEPISESPIIFNNGLAIVNNGGEFSIINENFDIVSKLRGLIQYKGNWVIVKSHNYMRYGYGPNSKAFKYGLFDFNSFSLIDYDRYLIPSAIYSDIETGKKLEHPLVGYRTFTDEYINSLEEGEGFIIPPLYNRGMYFIDGIAQVQKDGLWGFIDITGKPFVECKYEMLFRSDCDFIFAGVLNPVEDPPYVYKYGLIDYNGNVLSEFEYIFIGQETSEGFKRVMLSNRKWNFLDTVGKELLAYPVSNLSPFSNGRALVTNGSVSYFINVIGEKVMDKVYSEAKPYSDGLAAVTKLGTWGYINPDGEFMISPKYTWAGDFSSEFALVKTSVNADEYTSGVLINKIGDTYLEDLKITMISKFNDKGYALACSYDNIFYMIHIQNND